MNKDQDIRPTSFDDYVGQRATINVLRRAVVAARHGDRPCGHVLLAGLAGCIAGDMRVKYHVRDADGRKQNHKGGSMETLYHRFNRLPFAGRGGFVRPETEHSTYHVLCMNEERKLVYREIAAVVDSGVKECVRIRTRNGRELVCTSDHPIATPQGFKHAGWLRPGAGVLTHTKTRWRDSDAEAESVYRPEVLVKHHPHARTKVVRNASGEYEYKRLRRYRAAYEAKLNGLSLDDYISRLNEGSNLDKLLFSAPSDDIHHIDEDPTNDTPDNLIAISHADHAREHHANSDVMNNVFVAVVDVVETVTSCGPRHVYDVKMKSAPHNFVVADFVVHNCGKTSLANIIAAEMSTKLHAAVATAIEHKGELTGLLTTLGRHDVLFLDEIHGLSPAMQELLYTAMEDSHVDMPAGRKMIRINLQPFTLVGATTRAHLLTGPLRDRFAYTFQLGHYSVLELATIARKTMGKLGIRVGESVLGVERMGSVMTTEHVAAEIGRRSRGTPRVANRLVRNCRDFMESAGEAVLTLAVAEATFDALGLDSLGLDPKDREYLGILCERLGSPVGVLTIAAQLGLERGVIEGVIEPTLLELGLIARTQKGRIALPAAVKHLHAHAERIRAQQLAEPQPEMS
jgi:Holliday junction DNA helicase RuvB